MREVAAVGAARLRGLVEQRVDAGLRVRRRRGRARIEIEVEADRVALLRPKLREAAEPFPAHRRRHLSPSFSRYGTLNLPPGAGTIRASGSLNTVWAQSGPASFGGVR